MKPRWEPSLPQRKFKARAYREHPRARFQELSPTQIQTLTGNRSVQKWMEDEEFCDWFLNKDYTRQLLEAGSELAVQELLDILRNPDARENSKVAAAKLVLEMADYAPAKRKEVVFKDKEIDDMNKEELQDFVKENIHLVKKSQ